MRYMPIGSGETFDDSAVSMALDCFEEHGESGPHSPEGWMLSKILNFCVKQGIPFTLVHIPNKGYYVKRGVVAGIVPIEVQESFDED